MLKDFVVYNLENCIEPPCEVCVRQALGIGMACFFGGQGLGIDPGLRGSADA